MKPFSKALLAVAVALGFGTVSRAAEAVSPQTETINKWIAEGWKKAGVKHTSARCTDFEFIRRVFIDLIGRIATPEEVIDFEQDHSPNKRTRLVQRLLNSREYTPKFNGMPVKVDGKKALTFDYASEYAEHWANVWSVWLMSRAGHNVYREQLQIWLALQFGNNLTHKEMVTKLLTATGKTGDDSKNPDANAVNFIVHHLGEAVPNDKQSELGKFDAVPITSRITRLFLGIQTNCVQCHDHPFHQEWTQSDFWGVNAFFRQTYRDKTPTAKGDRRMMAEPAKVTLGDDSDNPSGVIFYERRDGKLMAIKPNFLKDLSKALENETDNKPIPKNMEGKTRRQVLADFIIKHDSFARAYINRIWGHLFGRGLNKEPSIDDFGSHNECIHPELVAALSEEFVKYNYDPKQLLAWICSSDVYSLSHVAVKENVDPKFDPYFTRMPLKALSPEVLYESLMTATKAEHASDANSRKEARERWMNKLVANFGDDEGNEINFNGTVVQALLMMNGNELNSEISRQTNSVRSIIMKHAKGGVVHSSAVIDELFLASLNRHPTSAEMSKINALMSKGAIVAAEKPKAGSTPSKADPKAGNKTPPPAAARGKAAQAPGNGPRLVFASGPNDISFYQDVFWALLNTNEFMLNH